MQIFPSNIIQFNFGQTQANFWISITQQSPSQTFSISYTKSGDSSMWYTFSSANSIVTTSAVSSFTLNTSITLANMTNNIVNLNITTNSRFFIYYQAVLAPNNTISFVNAQNFIIQSGSTYIIDNNTGNITGMNYISYASISDAKQILQIKGFQQSKIYNLSVYVQSEDLKLTATYNFHIQTTSKIINFMKIKHNFF